ncbi:hypothetical protein PTKIN_Ptkin14bG0177800 [Pterospermum kingtungense]
MVKFNVDGSAFGKSSPVGIGRVLRNHEGIELMCFSKHIGLEESNVAEIMAIKEVLVLFLASFWAKWLNLIIESDSKITIGWVNNPNEAPWKEANQRADQLVKKDVMKE